MSNRTRRRAEQRRTANSNRQSSASEAQIAANRQNSERSTGPVSDAGRAAVSQNRRVHGLNYNPATFHVLACEDQSQYDLLLQTFQDEQSPADTVEKLLVVSMAQHRWLLDRATRLQETCFDQQTGHVTDQKLFALYLRYATTHERAFHKCLNDLLKLRAAKQKLEFGFESQTRKAERHFFIKGIEETKLFLLQGQLNDREAEKRRLSTLESMEETIGKAA